MKLQLEKLLYSINDWILTLLEAEPVYVGNPHSIKPVFLYSWEIQKWNLTVKQGKNYCLLVGLNLRLLRQENYFSMYSHQ